MQQEMLGYVVATRRWMTAWGIGKSPEAAWEDFLAKMSEAGIHVHPGEGDGEDEVGIANYFVIPADTSLVTLGSIEGTKISWSLRRGLACLPGSPG